MFKSVTAKLGSMRKAVEFTICPGNENNQVIIQADRYIARFDRDTGVGVLSKSCANPGFMHLSKLMGATPITAPQEVLDAIKEQGNYVQGQQLAPGVFLG